MADFDFQGALKAGYSNEEILRHLASQGMPDTRLQQFKQKVMDARARNIRLNDKAGEFGQAPFPINPERAMQRLFGDYQDPSRPGPAAPPKPPLPWEMRVQEKTPQRPGMITGKPQFDILDATLDEMLGGTGKVARGVEQLSGPSGTPREAAAAGHDLISGAIGVSAPLMLESAVANPLKTAAVLGGAGLAQHGVEEGAQSLGVAPEYAGLAGDVAGIAAGGMIHGALPRGPEALRVGSSERLQDGSPALLNPSQLASGSPAAKVGSGAAVATPEVGTRGPVFRNFRHDAPGAVAELQKQQTGDALGALWHPEIGDIDLTWGKPGNPAKGFKDGFGLAHIIAKHEEMRGQLDQIGEILPRLKATVERGGDEVKLEDSRYRAVVSRVWQPKGQERTPKTWLLTMFEPK